jgi:hypothetical protein
MGICQCIETTNCFPNEIYSEKYHKYLTNNDNNEFETPENEEPFIVKGGKVENSNFNNFRQLRPTNSKKRLNGINLGSFINQSNRSEILFEDMSNFSRNESMSIDYYQISKEIFILLNDLRSNPDKYIKLLQLLLNRESPLNDKDKEKFSFPDSTENHNLIKELIEMIKTLLSNTEGKTSEPIIWSEKVYLTAYEYLIEVEEKILSANPNIVNKNSSERISNKFKTPYECLEINLNGSYNTETALLHILIENKDRLKCLLLDNYIFGAVCVFPTRNDHNLRTLLYLISKCSRLPKIKGLNPITGKSQELSLEDAIFERINYKNNIRNGTYQSDGKTLNVQFSLTNGETRAESFILD